MKHYVINPVESREASLDQLQTPANVPIDVPATVAGARGLYAPWTKPGCGLV